MHQSASGPAHLDEYQKLPEEEPQTHRERIPAKRRIDDHRVARRVSEANQTKSKVVVLQEATFLGFSIVHRKIRWTEKSQKKFKAEVRRLTKRTRGHSPVKVISDLRAYLRGAVNYYVIGIPFNDIRNLDQWLRRRMRLYHWKPA
jgi:hypothetical protein